MSAFISPTKKLYLERCEYGKFSGDENPMDSSPEDIHDDMKAKSTNRRFLPKRTYLAGTHKVLE